MKKLLGRPCRSRSSDARDSAGEAASANNPIPSPRRPRPVGDLERFLHKSGLSVPYFIASSKNARERRGRDSRPRELLEHAAQHGSMARQTSSE